MLGCIENTSDTLISYVTPGMLRRFVFMFWLGSWSEERSGGWSGIDAGKNGSAVPSDEFCKGKEIVCICGIAVMDWDMLFTWSGYRGSSCNNCDVPMVDGIPDKALCLVSLPLMAELIL